MSPKTSVGAFDNHDGSASVVSRPALSIVTPAGKGMSLWWPWKLVFELRANWMTWIKERARFAPTLSPAKTMVEGGTGSWSAPCGGYSSDR